MNNEKEVRIGIMGAMPEEINSIKELMQIESTEIKGKKEYIHGKLNDIDTTIVFSKWGKVAASSTVTTLIESYGITCLIFIGVAGAVSEELNIGDVVIGDKLYQHDMNASPIFQQFEVPQTNKIFFTSNESFVKNAYNATSCFFKRINSSFKEETLKKFSMTEPKCKIGTIGSGDQFINSIEKTQNLKKEMSEISAVEMEGASVAQICSEYDIPFVVLRTISDKANHEAVINFQEFVKEICSTYSKEIISEMYKAKFYIG